MNVAAPKSLTPTKLRIILMVSLALILIGGGVMFYFALNKLGQSATETGDKVATATQSQDTLQRLQTLQEDLEEKKDTIFMASNVVANSQNFAYQDRLVNDLTIYANRAGVSITNISFASQASGATQSAPVADAAPAAPGTGAETGAAITPVPAGLKKATVDITLASPTDYQNLLNFLHYVEQNLTKLKVSKVTMTKSENGVMVDALNLEVQVR